MLSVQSEVGRLRRVVVQPPGVAHERMLPKHTDPTSASYLLFDDLVHVPQARAEHDQLRAVLAEVSEVLVLEDMVAEVLADRAVRATVIEAVGVLEGLSDAVGAQLEALDPTVLTATLLAGTLGGGMDDPVLFHPIPNLIFTRDLAAVMGDLVVVGRASKPVRRRESILAWAVVEGHGVFRDAYLSQNSLRGRESAGPFTVEGGDVMVLSSTVACIGASERTTWSAIVNLAQELLQRGFVRVLVVEMPKQRSSMHLDTLFSLVDRGCGVLYRPMIEPGDPEEVHVVSLQLGVGGVVAQDVKGDLLEALSQQGHPLSPIWCGGGHPVHGRREQWTDGANYVCLGPGVAVGYARNEHTAEAMRAAGFQVVDPAEFRSILRVDHGGDPERLFASGRKLAIHIVGSELSRGRGGPRCLTLPLNRSAPD